MFHDRRDAGRRLSRALCGHAALRDVDKARLLVLAIPRGGIIPADVIARAFDCALDVLIVKKIGLPGYAEMAIGAMAEDGEASLNTTAVDYFRLRADELRATVRQTKEKIDHYTRLFRRGTPVDVRGKAVILVDDGVATGETVSAALRWLSTRTREHAPARTILALPVCSPRAAAELAPAVAAFVCLAVPDDFRGVGQFYREFKQVSDEEVLAILQRHRLAGVSDPA